MHLHDRGDRAHIVLKGIIAARISRLNVVNVAHFELKREVNTIL